MAYFWLFGMLFLLVSILILRVDWTPGRYKVLHHAGPDVGIKTKMLTGWLRIEDGQIRIPGEQSLVLPLNSLRFVAVFRLHGTGRMIRIVHDHDTLFVTVVRFSIAGRFAAIDFFKTGKLARRLAFLEVAS